MPDRFEHIKARYYYLSPMVNPHRDDDDPLYQNPETRAAVKYCLQHPRWRLCLQTHKIVNIA